MKKKPTTSTPDPEFVVPFDREITKGTPPARQEKKSCGDAANTDPRAQAAQKPGGGGAPATGEQEPEAPQGTAHKVLREHLVYLLREGGAHVRFEAAIAALPVVLQRAKPPGVSHSPWQLLEHMRIAQWDILEFIRNPHHVSPKFPEGYWPEGGTPPDEGAWNRSVANFQGDQRALCDLVADTATDLLAPIPHGEGQTILREALLVADHNAYHLGQLVVVRHALGAWPEQP